MDDVGKIMSGEKDFEDHRDRERERQAFENLYQMMEQSIKQGPPKGKIVYLENKRGGSYVVDGHVIQGRAMAGPDGPFYQISEEEYLRSPRLRRLVSEGHLELIEDYEEYARRFENYRSRRPEKKEEQEDFKTIDEIGINASKLPME